MFRPGPSLCAGGSGLQPPRSTEGHDRQLGLANLVIQRPEPIAAGALPLPPPRRVARDDQRPPATRKRPERSRRDRLRARSQATPELAGRKACAPCSPTRPTKPRRASCSDSPSIYQRSPTRDLRRARAVRPRERLTRRPGRAPAPTGACDRRGDPPPAGRPRARGHHLRTPASRQNQASQPMPMRRVLGTIRASTRHRRADARFPGRKRASTRGPRGARAGRP